MFSRYRIYHFEDFTCVPPVSIDSGKTHQKSPAHSLVLADFLQNVFGRFSRLALVSPPPTPNQFIIITCLEDLCSSGPVSQTQKGVRGGIEYDVPPCQNPQKIYKKYIRNCHRLSMYTIGIEKKSYMCPPGIKFLTPVTTWSGQYTSIVLIRFMLFKEPGSFKTIFKIGRNVDKLKAYRLIPLTPPLLFHFTLPLKG